jgi:hypothetical protein
MAICISQPVFHASLELNSNKTLAHMNFLAWSRCSEGCYYFNNEI